MARLHRWALTNEVDAVIARLTGHRFLLKEALGLGAVSEVATARIDMRVRKSGRTTGLTAGTIVDVSADVEVDYRDLFDEPRSFRNQMVIEGDQGPGDSGSVWIDESNRVVGLLFAGSEGGALANPISAVLRALNINLRTGVTMQDFIAITSGLLR